MIFHAYDIRGIYGDDLTPDIAHRIGWFLPRLLETRAVLVGRDARLSSPALFEALTRGITEAGADVHDLGLATTPMVYWFTGRGAYDASVMITASHNPAEYNGMKVSGRGVRPIGRDAGLDRLRRWVESDTRCVPVARRGKLLRLDRRHEYVMFLAGHRPDLGGLKMVVDTANGMGGLLVRDVLGDASAEYLFEELDGRFPNHDPNPLAHENLSVLKRRVVETGADLGIAFDGDADRVMFIDETGRFVPPDLVIAVLGLHFAARGHERMRILQDIRTSRSVAEFLQPLDVSIETWKVGRAFAAQKLREIDALYGGELAGHYYFKDFFYNDSGMLAMLRVLDVVARRKREGGRFSALVDEITRYASSGEVNFKLDRKQEAMDAVRDHYRTHHRPTAFHDFDGYRIEFDDWWFNIRPSNTEPYLRLVVEARTPALVERHTADLSALIERHAQA